jgi:transcriptional regulator
LKAHDTGAEAETVRQRLRAALAGRTFTARELSGMLSIPEREVYGHLEHLRRTLQSSDQSFVVIPSRCRKCGFLFSKRDKLKKPGRCPQCRETLISEPLFTID